MSYSNTRCPSCGGLSRRQRAPICRDDWHIPSAASAPASPSPEAGERETDAVAALAWLAQWNEESSKAAEVVRRALSTAQARIAALDADVRYHKQDAERARRAWESERDEWAARIAEVEAEREVREIRMIEAAILPVIRERDEARAMFEHAEHHRAVLTSRLASLREIINGEPMPRRLRDTLLATLDRAATPETPTGGSDG